jgi:hypothetical protein
VVDTGRGGRYLILDNLSPLAALQILAAAAQSLRAAGRGTGPLLDVRIKIETLGSITTVELLTPAGDGRQQALRNQPAAEALLRAYTERAGMIVPTPRDVPLSSTDRLAEGIARLLLHPDGAGGRAAEREPTECLLVAEGIDVRRAAQVFEDARFDATSVRTLVALAAQDAGRPDRAVYLFHVRDDRGRRSTFQGAISGERFVDCTLLACYDVHGAKVFLPAEIEPGRAELEAFRELVRALPLTGPPGQTRPATGLNGAAGTPLDGYRADRDERLVAVYPRRPDGGWHGSDAWRDRSEGGQAAGAQQYAVAYLGALAFRDQVDMQPRRRAGTFEMVDLRASEAVAANLRDVIERSGAGVGYRLELRTTEYAELPEVAELARLDQEIYDLELRRAALRSLSPQKPLLFRFSQHQLPGLADVLRAYPPRTLLEGALQYGFQPASGVHGGETVPGERSGLHYLLVDPMQAGPMMEKLRFPEMSLPGPTMRFWLDPYWARYYLDEYGNREECLVFVPYGTALFPSMHDWDAGEMREYLQFAVRRWFVPAGGGEAAESLPERAVYIFDGPPDPYATIHVTVLDRDGLHPLQERIGWINTNLEAMRPDPEIGDIVAGLADLRGREAVIEAVSGRVAASQAAFDQAVVAANAHVAAHLQELLDSLTRELAALIDRAGRTTQDVVRLKSRLRDLDTTRLDMRRLDVAVTGTATQAGAAADDLNTYYNAQLTKAQQAVQRADASRVAADKEIAEAVLRLRQTREHLEKLLERLL